MSDFAKWLREWWRVGKLPYEQGIVRDLVNLCAQQHEALEMHARIPQPDKADCRRAADVALKDAEDFQEKYE